MSSWPPLHQYLSLPLPQPKLHALHDTDLCSLMIASNLRIYFTYLTYDSTTCTYPTDRHLSVLGPTDYVFLLLSWHRMGFDKARLQAMQRFDCTCVVCANTAEEWAELQAAGVRSIYFNQNALLDERIFSQRGNVSSLLSELAWPLQQLESKPGSSTEAPTATATLLKEVTQNSSTTHNPALSLLGCDCDKRHWDLVVNSSLAGYKRLHLAGSVINRVHIGYPVPGLDLVSPLSSVLLVNSHKVQKSSSNSSSNLGCSDNLSSGGGCSSRLRCSSGVSSSGGGDGSSIISRDSSGSSSVKLVSGSNSCSSCNSHGGNHPTHMYGSAKDSGEASSRCQHISSPSTGEAPLDEPYKYLSPFEVSDILHQAKVGGIFSAEEGPCYACTEYLFAGLPVITTPSCGGRHVWLNSHNSITVKACCESKDCTCDGKIDTSTAKQAVAQAVAFAVEAVETGVFDRAKIRQDAITMAWQFRDTLVNEIQLILDGHGLGEVMDVKEYFCRTFTHKLQGCNLLRQTVDF